MSANRFSGRWFDFVANNHDKVTTLHTAMLFLCIEINLRTGYDGRFTVWTDIAMQCFKDATIQQLHDTIKDLATFGFIEIIHSSHPDAGWVISLKWATMFNYN